MDATPLPAPEAVLLWERKLCNAPCAKVVEFDEKLHSIVRRLKSTCYANNGLGLAAPQIGEFVRVALVHYPQEEEPLILVNPVIDEINSKGEQVMREGCLSLPTRSASGAVMHVEARVRRCQEIVYAYQDITGKQVEAKATGMLARVISHEVDHLHGIFYIDRVGDTSRQMVLRAYHNFLRINYGKDGQPNRGPNDVRRAQGAGG